MGEGWLIESETTCQLTSINWIFQQKVFFFDVVGKVKKIILDHESTPTGIEHD